MKKILVANRGEIAIRVMKSAKKMGIKTVAVYSEADRVAPHVQFADEAVFIGPAPSSESYLVIDKIIKAAESTGADGIHPGYGFLSENAEFAERVIKAGIIFIGPSVHAIKVMGNKLAAKEAVAKYEIPMVPGIDKAITDVEKAKVIAKDIGFPILIKAAAGGGGKGMRVVHKLEDLEDQMKRAISEAQSAFGDGSVFIERYVTSPRHIEIQMLADKQGNTIHLFERECSIQRRHQKVVEEAPSSIVDEDLRHRMGQAAIKVAQSCDYEGAGTVEFLVEGDKEFYFLEMNTRLQVEHPVTELISGVDIVEEQIRIADGLSLSYKQEDLRIDGHALELRIYAEDPLNNFLPSVGTLTKYRPPVGTGIRLDDGYEEGMEIPINYDPMIAKLVTKGETREEAIQLMIKAIDNFQIEGIQTTLPFGKFVCQHEAFTSGNFNTQFVDKYFSAQIVQDLHKSEAEVAAKIALKYYLEQKTKVKMAKKNGSNWKKRNLLS